MLGGARVLQLVGFSFVGSVLSWALVYTVKTQWPSPPPEDTWSEEESIIAKVDEEPARAWWDLGKYWKLAGFMGLMLSMEALKEFGNAESDNGVLMRLWRVFNLYSFRDALRGVRHNRMIKPTCHTPP